MAKAKQSRKRLVVSDDMTIYNAAAQKEKLLQALAGCQELDVDLSKVGEIDTAGVQVLILASREAGKTGKVMRLSAHSGAVGEMLGLLNMGSYFEMQAGQEARTARG